LKKLVIGSHHDAVPNGGKYDGAMGVLFGLEVMQCILENGIWLRHPYEVLMFTAEEPNPFSISTMGSRSITGKIPEEMLLSATDCYSGMPLPEAIKRAGGDLSRLKEDRMTDKEMSAFIECHIEQSRNLDDAGLSVATVGKLDVKPNSANIIPDSVSFIMEIRTSCEEEKQAFLHKVAEEFAGIEKKGTFPLHGLQMGRHHQLQYGFGPQQIRHRRLRGNPEGGLRRPVDSRFRAGTLYRKWKNAEG
jgi:acetylornithine deacetylase/succinyl-diaminopimelate desuccinylase-like protein